MTTRILIVDDQERLLRVLRLGLKELGYDVATALNGEGALKEIHAHRPDVVVTDMQMPLMGGVELIYEMERLQMGIPVVVMTAHADVDSAVKSLKHGAKDYIQKPFTVAELHAVIESVLDQYPAALADSFALQESVNLAEREAILKALNMAGNVKVDAAKLLKISERALWYKIKKYNI
ncbi:MAG: response regulator [Candidatus Omnitrophica bacterium]|nr:response regulator [Candidatus Omnitrophota bacterium]